MQTLRTPDERFARVPGFDLPPQYADVPGEELAVAIAGFAREVRA
jgi:hypothetical protein